MQSRTVYGKGLNTPKMQEIRIEAHGRGGAVGIKCVQTLVAHIESFKAAETPQEVYDRFMTVCGYCSCCRDAGFWIRPAPTRLCSLQVFWQEMSRQGQSMKAKEVTYEKSLYLQPI